MKKFLPLTIAYKGERIYIDANVLVYYFYSKYRKDFSKNATDLLNKVATKKFEGIISNLTIMELIKSLRELLVEYGKIGKIADIDTIVEKTIKPLFLMDNICFVEGRPTDFEPAIEIAKLYYHSASNECLKLMNVYKGKVGSDYTSGMPKHQGLHAPDFFHLFLAKQLRCDKIATFDWAFQETRSEVVPLILQDRDATW
jgi:predicted nucleic acid-binding protein